MSYKYVLSEFAKTPSNVKTLRLLPISEGIFGSEKIVISDKETGSQKKFTVGFNNKMPHVTLKALSIGLSKLTKSERDMVFNRHVEMCIYEDTKFDNFTKFYWNF